MTDNKITPEQFVKQWLPEYESRWTAYFFEQMKDATVPARVAKNFLLKRFCRKYHSEALAAYTDHVRKEAWDQACEKQREVLRKDAIDSFNIILSKTNMYRTEQMAVLNDFCRNYDNSAKLAPAPEFKITEK